MMFNMEKVYFGRTGLVKPGDAPNYSLRLRHNHEMMFTMDELLGLQDHINGLVEEAKRSGVDVTVERPVINV